MPRAEKGSSKALANKIKSKGLQKLKWFCQMCQKQCRDQNGFKCHLTSESHQRQLLLFAENQGSYLRQFSRDFEGNYMHIFKHTFGGKRTRANVVYQEFIKDKGHIHMNSTVWHSLGGFVRYLGDSGKCKIDQDEKGWHITYIDQEEEMRKQKLKDKAKQELSDEERINDILQRRIQRALEQAGEDGETEIELREFVRPSDDHKIQFDIPLIKPTKAALAVPVKSELPAPALAAFGDDSDDEAKPTETELDIDGECDEAPPPPRANFGLLKPPKRIVKIEPLRAAKKRSAFDEVREQEERYKNRRRNRY